MIIDWFKTIFWKSNRKQEEQIVVLAQVIITPPSTRGTNNTPPTPGSRNQRCRRGISGGAHRKMRSIRKIKEQMQGHKCFYCKRKFNQGKAFDWPTADHIVPHSKGGKIELDNIVAACDKCNRTKDNMDFDEFILKWKPLTSNKMSWAWHVEVARREKSERKQKCQLELQT